MKSSKLRKVLSVIGNVVLWVFVAFAVFMTILVLSSQGNKNEIPNFLGKSFITIQSNSMDPTFKAGDLIIGDVLTDDQKKELQKGDVITFYADLNGDGVNELNTHRIVDKYEKSGYIYYVTKGDNPTSNPINDKDPVISQYALAKYTGTRVPGVGTVINFLQSSVGFLVVIVIPLVIFFLYELYSFIMQVRRLKGKKTISQADEEEIKRRAVEEYMRQKEEQEEEIKKRAIEEYLRRQEENKDSQNQKDENEESDQ